MIAHCAYSAVIQGGEHVYNKSQDGGGHDYKETSTAGVVRRVIME